MKRGGGRGSATFGSGSAGTDSRGNRRPLPIQLDDAGLPKHRGEAGMSERCFPLNSQSLGSTFGNPAADGASALILGSVAAIVIAFAQNNWQFQ